MFQLSMWKCNKQNTGNTEEESISYVWDRERFFKEGEIWAWSPIIFFLEKTLESNNKDKNSSCEDFVQV